MTPIKSIFFILNFVFIFLNFRPTNLRSPYSNTSNAFMTNEGVKFEDGCRFIVESFLQENDAKDKSLLEEKWNIPRIHQCIEFQIKIEQKLETTYVNPQDFLQRIFIFEEKSPEQLEVKIMRSIPNTMNFRIGWHSTAWDLAVFINKFMKKKKKKLLIKKRHKITKNILIFI